jgi:hypothetical protein
MLIDACDGGPQATRLLVLIETGFARKVLFSVHHREAVPSGHFSGKDIET